MTDRILLNVRDRIVHRKRLREQGLRSIAIWVPDVRSPELVKRLGDSRCL